uniref:Putative secreted protein n=1 Tax=Ixodes ricinus TaxID=34613 RepID=A0A6B0U6E5_IXORI
MSCLASASCFPVRFITSSSKAQLLWTFLSASAARSSFAFPVTNSAAGYRRALFLRSASQTSGKPSTSSASHSMRRSRRV